MTMLLWNVFFQIFEKGRNRQKILFFFQELSLSLFEYINGFYNPLRPHSHNNGLSPNQAEKYFFYLIFLFFLSTLLTIVQECP